MNTRVRALAPSDILKCNNEIAGIDGIIKLTLGEPDFATPGHVKAAGIGAIRLLFPHQSSPLYIPIPQLNGAKTLFVDTSQDGFILTPDKLRSVIEQEGGSRS